MLPLIFIFCQFILSSCMGPEADSHCFNTHNLIWSHVSPKIKVLKNPAKEFGLFYVMSFEIIYYKIYILLTIKCRLTVHCV